MLASADGSDVMVAPITSQPTADRDVIEIPSRVAGHLGLDTSRTSKVVVDEVNMFHWPSDLRQIGGQAAGVFHYGFIPPKLFKQVSDAIVRNHAKRSLTTVKRRS